MRKNISLLVSYFRSFLIFTLFSFTPVYGMNEEEKRNMAVILTSTFDGDVQVNRRTLAGNFKDLSRILREGITTYLPFIVKRSQKASHALLKLLPELLQTKEKTMIQGLNFHMLLDFLISRLPVSQRSEEKPQASRGTVVFLSLPTPDIRTLFHNYEIFGMTRKRFIEMQTNPPFYSIFYREEPLNIFILPTVHTLPLEALHPRILNCIHAIAKTEGSKLITEIHDESSDDEEDDDSQSQTDAGIKLTVEQFIERELAYYTPIWRGVYVKDENDIAQLVQWKLECEKLETSSRKIYEEGWANSLNAESKETLKLFLKMGKRSFEYINGIDPIYLHFMINNLVNEGSFEQIEKRDLDWQIDSIFLEQQKKIQALENDDDRYVAEREHIISSLPMYIWSFSKCKSYLEKSLQRFKNLVTRGENLEPVYYCPDLGDLDFQDDIHMAYLMGRDFDEEEEDVGMNIRNQNWWKKTINPLLEERKEAVFSPNFPAPVLLVYGVGHNEGAFSITGLIQKKKGFQVRKLRPK